MTPGLAAAIAEAVAAVDDTEPTELDYVLHDYIPVDAIQRLADHETATWRLWFELPRHQVTVTSDGMIFVDGIHDQIPA